MSCEHVHDQRRWDRAMLTQLSQTMGRLDRERREYDQLQEAADVLEKAAEAVIVNQQLCRGDLAGVSGQSVVDEDLLTDLDTARDAYRKAKKGESDEDV